MIKIAKKLDEVACNWRLQWAGCMAAVLLFLPPLEAAVWNLPPGQPGDWSVAGNWTGGLPTSNSTANIGNGGTVTVTLPGAVYSSLTLSNGWVLMSDGTLTGNSPSVTNNGSFLQSGGTNTVKSYLNIESVAPTGGYNLSGGSLLAANEAIGDGGINGSFVQSGGSNSVSNYFYLGYNATGTYDLSGGSLSAAGDESLGYFTGGAPRGNAIFTQSGGTNTVGGTLRVGDHGGIGRYSLSGSGIITANNEQIGSYYGGTGCLTQTGGTNNVANSLVVGSGALYYYLSGSGKLSASSEYVSNGAIMLQAGGVNTVTQLWVAQSGTGTYDLRGGALSATSEVIGYYPQDTGKFMHSGGSNIVGKLQVGYSMSGTGYYSLGGSAQLSATEEYIGDEGIGTMTQTGGTNTVGTLWLGHFIYANPSFSIAGIYNLSGSGILNVTGAAYLGQGNPTTGTFTQTGGSSSFGALRLGDTTGSSGICSLSGGTMTLRGLSAGAGTATFNFNGGILRAGTTFSTALPIALNTAGGNATIDTAGYNLTCSGALSGPGNLIKTGSGTLVLAGANNYTGPTAVTAGTLSLTGSLSPASALALGGATFSYAPTGTGKSQTVAGLTLNPGSSIINASTGNTLALGGIARITAGVVDFNSNTTGKITTSRANANGILGPWATYGSGTNTQYAAATGGNVVAYSGATIIASGVTGLTDTTGSVNYAISSGGDALTAAVCANTARFSGASNTLTASATNTLSLNGIMNVGSGTATIAGGDLIVGATKELVITGPGNATILSAIRDNAGGQSALTVAGSGTLLLGGANAYSGNTVVCAGTLKLGDAAALPQGAGAGNLVLYKTLDLNNFSAGVNGLLGNGVVTSSVPGAPTLTVGNNDATSTFGGIIQNGAATAMALDKIGGGTLSLTGNHIYTGPTTILAGKLNVTGSLAAGSVVSVDGGGMLGGSGNGVSTGIVNGPVTVAGGSSAAAQGALDFVDNSLGSLYLGGTLALGGEAGNPSMLNLEFGSEGFDRVAVSGGLTLNAGGGVINLTSLGACPALGTYDLLTFAGQAGTGTFTFPGGLSEQIFGNRKFILSNTGTAEQIIVNNSAGSAWTGGGGDGNWTNAANWVGGTIPGATNGAASADTVTFNAPTDGRLPVVIDAGRNIQNLIFDDVAGPYTIGSAGGNALLLSAGGTIQTTPSVAVTQVVAAPLAIQGSAGTYTIASNGTANSLSFQGSISGSAISGNTTQLTLNGTNATGNTIGGTISDGLAGGSLAITKTDAGSWILSGANTYTGGTTLLAGTLTLGSNSAVGTGPFTLVGGTLSATNQYVGSPGVRSLTQSGGTNSVPGSLYLGYTAGTSGTYQMSAGTLSVAGGNWTPSGYEYVGYSGTGTFTQSGGTHTFSCPYSGSLYIGYNAGSVGTYEMSGTGLLTASYWEDSSTVWVGYSGTGYFTQTGGTVDMTSGINIGNNAGSNGTYTLSSGTVIAPSQYVGISGTGIFTQSGGTNRSNAVSLGSNAGSSGTYNLNGGTLILASLNKGSGTAAFNFSGGTLQISSTCSMPINLATGGGNATIDTGSNNVTFSSPLSGPGNLIKIGTGKMTLLGTNTFSGKTIVNGGTLAIAGESGLGVDPGSFTADQLILNGGALQTTATCSIGSGNRGVTLGIGGGAFSPNGGTVLTAVNPIVGSGALVKNGDGTLVLPVANTYVGGTTLSAGQINLNSPAALPAGTFTISGGSIGNTSGGAIDLANDNPQAWTASFKFVGPQDLNLGSGAVTLNSSPTLTVNTGTLTVDGPISGGYSLTKAGNGTLVLGGANLYSGTTTISAGRLAVDGSLASTGVLTVQNGGTLGGDGSIAGPVIVNSGGHVAPGDSIGTLNLAGNLTLASDARLDFELGPVAASDQIAMATRTLTLNGQDFSTISLTLQDGFGPGAYTLIDAGNVSGTGLGSNITRTIGAWPATLSIGGPDGHDLVLTVVPEPSTLALLVIGALTLLTFAWKYRRSGS